MDARRGQTTPSRARGRGGGGSPRGSGRGRGRNSNSSPQSHSSEQNHTPRGSRRGSPRQSPHGQSSPSQPDDGTRSDIRYRNYFLLKDESEFRMPHFNQLEVSESTVKGHLIVTGMRSYAKEMQYFFVGFDTYHCMGSHINKILDSDVSVSLNAGQAVSLHYVMIPLLDFISKFVASYVDAEMVNKVMTAFSSRLSSDNNWLSRSIQVISGMPSHAAPVPPKILTNFETSYSSWTDIFTPIVKMFEAIVSRNPGVASLMIIPARRLVLEMTESRGMTDDCYCKKQMNRVLETCGVTDVPAVVRQVSQVTLRTTKPLTSRAEKKAEAAKADDSLAVIGPGRRHGNDKPNIRDINVVPTIEELLCGYVEYMPRNAPTDPNANHHLPIGTSRLIDINFRLFRQDALIGLRDALVKFLVIDGNTTPDKWDILKGKHVLRSDSNVDQLLDSRMVLAAQRIAQGMTTVNVGCESSSYDPTADMQATSLDDMDDTLLDNNRAQLNRRVEHEVIRNPYELRPARIQGDTDLWLYHDVRPIDIDVVSKMGVTIFFEFADVPQVARLLSEGNDNKKKDPVKERKRYWEQCRRLMDGSLIIVFSYENDQLRASFCVVSNRDRLVDGRNQVGLTFRSMKDFEHFAPWTLYSKFKSDLPLPTPPRMIMIQTKAYWKSYEPVLDVIKIMTPLSIPECLNGPMVLGVANNDMPSYVARSPVLNLSCLSRSNDLKTQQKLSRVSIPLSNLTRNFIQQNTSLDDSQIAAISEAFNHPLVAIQGPPGCGKTFVGVKIVQSIIDTYYNGQDDNMPPILCVCYTNHALDSFLLSLLDAKVVEPQRICRVGRVPKESDDGRLSDIHIRNLHARPIPKLYAQMKGAEKLFNESLGDDDQKLNWETVNEIVQFEMPELYRDLEVWVTDKTSVTMNGWHKWSLKDAWASWTGRDSWLKGKFDRAKQTYIDAFKSKDIETSNPFEVVKKQQPGDVFDRNSGYRAPAASRTASFRMKLEDRMSIVQSIVSSVCADRARDICRTATTYHAACVRVESDRNRATVDLLKDKHIVAMTTSGAAINIEIIRALKPKIIIVEEAAECLEAHILALLSPETEHLIMIGDHKQLRPSVSDYRMDKDCLSHALDLNYSLFERVVEGPVPPVTLQYQHRMRPEIADLIRASAIYHQLNDHESVTKYPPLKGFKDNVIFIDHNQYEGGNDIKGLGRIKSVAERSHVNVWEARMVAGMTLYLLRQGYISSDNQKRVTILTPYVGQLLLIKNELDRIGGFRCAFTEGDTDLLHDMDEDIESSTEDTGAGAGAGASGAKDIQAKYEVKVATIDNYQGEEADVVVLSTVRNFFNKSDSDSFNRGKRVGIGFLDSINRCNVMMSRARHGLVILGNARLLERESEFFKNVIPVLRSRGQIHDGGLDIKCEKHPNTERYISNGAEFAKYSPEGGCTLPCGQIKQCTHVCKRSCHHDACDSTVCTEKCLRIAECGLHRCRDICGKPCPAKCTETVVFTLQCGHTVQGTCWQQRHPDKVVCKAMVTKTHPHCGHEVLVRCNVDVSTVQCNALVDKTMPNCSHKIKVECHQDVTVAGYQCPHVCERLLLCGHVCGHACGEHIDNKCPQCKNNCMHSCSHDNCHHECSKPCKPCTAECDYKACGHGIPACPLPCFMPCYRLPCNKRCLEKLPCGHRCPCVCGERCAAVNECVECIIEHRISNDNMANQMVDLVEGKTLIETYSGQDAVSLDQEPIIILPCGHVFLVSNIDQWYSMSDQYVLDRRGAYVGFKSKPPGGLSVKTCIVCRAPILTFKRYKRIVRSIALVDIDTKNANVFGAKRNQIAQALGSLGDDLVGDSTSPVTGIINCDEAISKLLHDVHDRDSDILSSVDGDGTRWRDEHEAVLAWGAVTLMSRACDPFKHKIKKKLLSDYFKSSINLLDNFKHSAAVIAHSYVVGSVPEADREKALSYIPTPNANSLLHAVMSLQGTMNAMNKFLHQLANKQPELNDDITSLILFCIFTMCEAFDDAFAALCQCKSWTSGYELMVSHVTWLSVSFGLLSDDLRTKMHELLIKCLKHCMAMYERDMRQCGVLHNIIQERCTEVNRRLGSLLAPTHAEIVEMLRVVLKTSTLSGHVYYCPNGHVYTIGECGGPMQIARCPECNAVIGGADHLSENGNVRATDYEH